MAYFNKILLMGNLTRDPELSYTPQGVPVCKFGLAVNNTYTDAQGNKKENPMFIDIVVWKKQAENCAKYLKKGNPAFVEGRLQLDQWEKDGVKRSKHKVTAQSVKFLGQKPQDEQAPDGQPTPSTEQDGVDDLPF